MAKAPFVVTPELCAVAVEYKNGKMIADEALPRVPVDAESFKYQKTPMGEFFTVPETKVGRKGQPNQVEFSSSEQTDSTQDHGLDDLVPNKDVKNAAAQSRMVDPLKRAAMGLTELIVLAREVRAANLVFNTASYGAGNQATLSGTNQVSDYVNSNPQTMIMDAMDTMIMRPNIGIMGRSVWTKFSQHPRICKAVFGNNTDAGVVSRAQVAALLELDDIYVGEGWVNLARRGQPVNMARVWGKGMAFLRRNMTADTQYGVTFGMTAQFGDRIGGEIEDADIGIHGGVRVRVAESVKELVTANDLGYFFQNAIA
jgi:hypothetical protein